MKTMTTTDILRQAKEVIVPEECWTRGMLGRDSDGKGVSGHDPRAVAWCEIGAVMAVTGTNWWDLPSEPIRALAEAISPGYYGSAVKIVADHNNDPATSHADVLDVFDRAMVAAAKVEGRREPSLWGRLTLSAR